MKKILMIVLLSLFFVNNSFADSYPEEYNNERDNDNDVKAAINKTTKALRTFHNIKIFEKKLKNTGKEFIEDVPYSEEVLMTVALLFQPMRFKIDRNHKIELDYKNEKISYLFSYDF